MVIISWSRYCTNILQGKLSQYTLPEKFDISLNFNCVACAVMKEELMIELCVHGYHVYVAIGEEPPCECETRNTKDRYAVAVKNFTCENIRAPASTAKISTHKFNYGYNT